MKKNIVFLLLVFLWGGLYGLRAQGLTEISNLSYLAPGEVEVDSLQQLNLVLPEGVDKPPLFIWIGGGAWAFVDRHQEMDFARKMAAEGIAVASIGHRLSPGLWRDSTRAEGVQHPEHIKDVAKAFRWLYDHAFEYGYDRDRMFIGGFSSGAHLAALLSMDTRYLESVGLKQENIKGFVPVSGGYDIVSYYEVFVNGPNPSMAELHVQAVFGQTEEDMIDASPITYLDNMKLPMLMFSENMTYNYTTIFEDALRETEFRNFEVIHVHKLGHADLWRNLSFAEESPYRERMIQFIKGPAFP
jgi:dipeptidyl aminopeptidase/acylaminoacyl peptidase